jgi:hypothetical protein
MSALSDHIVEPNTAKALTQQSMEKRYLLVQSIESALFDSRVTTSTLPSSPRHKLRMK